MSTLLFYEQINLLLLLGSGGLILLIFLFPMPRKQYLLAEGVLHELPPLAPVIPSKYPDQFDKLLTVFYIIATTLLFAVSCIVDSDATKSAEQIPQLTDIWFNTLIPFIIYLPLIMRYTIVSGSLQTLKFKYCLIVFVAILIIHVLNVLIGVTGFYNWLINVTDSPETQQTIQSMKSASKEVFIPLAVGAIVVAPIVEEFFFRGFIFRILSCRIGVIWAALLSGIYFGAVHLSLVQTVTLSIFGIVQCFLYVKTRSIIYPIIMHTIFNAIAVTQLCFTLYL